MMMATSDDGNGAEAQTAQTSAPTDDRRTKKGPAPTVEACNRHV
jgi:hypothetical protein